MFALLYAGFVEIWAGDLEAAATVLDEVVETEPGTNMVNGGASAETLLAWVENQLGRPEARGRLAELQEARSERVSAGSAPVGTYVDLVVTASVLDSPSQQLRWFLESARRDEGGDVYMLRRVPWLDRIRGLEGYRRWLRETEDRLRDAQKEIEILGPWTPEAVLGAGTR